MTARPETLVIVDREGTLQIEIRELLREGDRAYLLFDRSDGTVARVEIDQTKLRETVEGRVPADLTYRGGAVIAPQQDV